MGEILVTGPAGNVGREVVACLLAGGAGVRTAVFSAGRSALPSGAGSVPFDFADPATYPEAFRDVDRLFLLRPPQIADVKRLLFPVIDYALGQGVRQIVFLSLQGAEFNVFTPHHRVEEYLRAKSALHASPSEPHHAEPQHVLPRQHPRPQRDLPVGGQGANRLY